MFVFKICMQKYIGKNSTLSEQNVWNKNNTVEYSVEYYSSSVTSYSNNFLLHMPWLNKATSKGFCPALAQTQQSKNATSLT